MKVFVYSKLTNIKIAMIQNVVEVHHPAKSGIIAFYTDAGETFTFNTHEVKTTTYQN